MFIGKGLSLSLRVSHFLPNINGTVTLPQHIPLDLCCYTNSDWARDKTTRIKTTGWLCLLLNNLLSYARRTENTVTLSSAKVELMALSSGMAEALRLRQLIKKSDWHGFDYLWLQQQEKHHTAHRQHKPSQQTWSEQTFTTHQFTLLVEARPTTTRTSLHQEGYSCGESCRHLHQTTTGTHLWKHVRSNGLLALSAGEGEETCTVSTTTICHTKSTTATNTCTIPSSNEQAQQKTGTTCSKTTTRNVDTTTGDQTYCATRATTWTTGRNTMSTGTTASSSFTTSTTGTWSKATTATAWTNASKRP